MTNKLIVFTDLDGTLLNHDDYCYESARKALTLCSEKNIPIIFNTSKTRQETEQLREQLRLRHPFVVENGSAVYIPTSFSAANASNSEWQSECTYSTSYWTKCLGTHRVQLVQFLFDCREQHQFKLNSYSDLSLEEIAQLTQLSVEQAHRSAQRQFSEPFQWLDSQSRFELFQSLCERQGLRVLKGGRFHHLIGLTDKGIACRWIMDKLYPLSSRSEAHITIALGDSENDMDMFFYATVAVAVRPLDREPITIPDHPNLITTEATGSAGWNDALCQLIEQYHA